MSVRARAVFAAIALSAATATASAAILTIPQGEMLQAPKDGQTPQTDLIQPAGVTVPSPIPEPSTWVMILIGFTGLGYAGWKTSRKRADSVA
jgi:PEP-CTERM motif